MSWDAREWTMFCVLVEEAWPGEFDDDARTSWRVLLDDIDPEATITAIKRLLYSGRKFYPRPAVSDVLAELRSDPSLPTFDEAWVLIRRALRAPGYGEARRALMDERGTTFIREDEERALRDRVTIRSLEECHPMVGSFVARVGLDRLRSLPFDDPEWGDKYRRDLKASWDETVQSGETRQIAVLASGDREGLRKLDPLTGLGIGRELPALERAA